MLLAYNQALAKGCTCLFLYDTGSCASLVLGDFGPTMILASTLYDCTFCYEHAILSTRTKETSFTGLDLP